MKKLFHLGLLWSALTLFTMQVCAQNEPPNDIPKVPTPDMVTMLDLGAHKCVPCKMMAPVIAELQKEYEGRASVIFIDVWKNPAEARRYGIQAIPTQIFYDTSGTEVARHVGYLDKNSIVELFDQLGVPGKAEE